MVMEKEKTARADGQIAFLNRHPSGVLIGIERSAREGESAIGNTSITARPKARGR
jgi:hypothetical protein